MLDWLPQIEQPNFAAYEVHQQPESFFAPPFPMTVETISVRIFIDLLSSDWGN
jgi:hypothetical protein